MTPPAEPMLLFAAVAASLYLLLWRLWLDAFVDEGIELEYTEEGP